MRTAAVIVAAGRGQRAGSKPLPKQYRIIGSRPVIAHSVAAFVDHPAIDAVQVVISDDHTALYRRAVAPHPRLLPPAVGGATRQESVRRGLRALAEANPDRVLIHDAARPFVSAELIARVADKLDTAAAVVPVGPLVDTIKRIGADGSLTETVSRADLVGAQTPQGFAYAAIAEAHQKAAGAALTDDAAVAAAAGITVESVAGSVKNAKITSADDLAIADELAQFRGSARLDEVRVGVGYDVHALAPGTEVTLGGVVIEHTARLIGHSDADVVLHALTDAVLGALAEGDIGAHFPPGEERWKDTDSAIFLAFAAERVRQRNGIIAHLDVTLVGEAPQLAPHRDRIRAKIAEICGIATECVGAKATTSEGLGFTGRREGLAAHAIATIRLPIGSRDE